MGIATLYGLPAAAESAVDCFNAHITEVFAGTAECPDSDYVVVKADAPDTGSTSNIVVLDHCGAAVGAFGDEVVSVPQPVGTFLVARPGAESLFGISADMSAASDLPTPNGALLYGCSPTPVEVVYGDYPGANAPALPLGKALKWNGASWELGDPQPMNSKGQTGVLGTCPNSDASGVAGAAGASGSSGGSDAGYPPCGGGTGGFGNETGNGGMTTEAGAKDSAPETSDLNDADVGKHPASSEDNTGCGCRLGMSNSDRFVAALVLAALGVMFRRAFRR